MLAISQKNGCTANESGAVICASVAPPSSRVLIIALMAMSQPTCARTSVSIGRSGT